jgi:gliding motility-associated-like protein
MHILCKISLMCFIIWSQANTAWAQIPTTQDCLGAIPVCQNVYVQPNSFSGAGNYPGEINGPASCLGSEVNSVWYTFTVQTSGDLSFTLSPNGTDDYDWGVYNLTNNVCADIFTNPALEVSCNFYGLPGPTGPNGNLLPNGTLSPWSELVIPVLAGETYVILISNYNSINQTGYTLDFSASTAQIFDNIPPAIDEILPPIACGATTISFAFTENVLCNTVDPADFQITGPGGPYTVTVATSALCAAGASYTNIYDLTVTPAITTSGAYNLSLVGTVTDLCGNVGILNTGDNFSVTALDVTVATNQTSCFYFEATATVVNGMGTPPYVYSWTTNPVQNTQTATNLGNGTFQVTVTDAGGCIGSAFAVITVVPTLVLSTSSTPADCGVPNGSAQVTVNIGTGPFTYVWNPPVAGNTGTANNLLPGTYAVTITDANNCSLVENIVVPQIGLTLVVSPDVQVCTGLPVNLSAVAGGGSPPYNYTWSGGLPNSSVQNFVPPTSAAYTVFATDVNGCTSATLTINVDVLPPLALVLNGGGNICEGDSSLLVVSPSGGDGLYQLTWNQGIGLTNDYEIWVSPNSTANFEVTLSDGCGSSTVSQNVDITVIPAPDVDFNANSLEGCTPFGVDLFGITNADPSSSYYWLFGTEGSSANINPTAIFQLPGCKDISFSVVDGVTGCKSTITKPCYLNALLTPNANFVIEPPVVNISNNPDAQVTSTTQDVTYYEWSMEGINQGNNPSWKYEAQDTGTFRIMLKVMADGGCMDSVVKVLKVITNSSLYIPSAFTPNGDGENDVFGVASANISKGFFSMSIYNRWGMKVFETENPELFWDGNGCPQGTYVYVVNYKSNDANKRELIGAVTLLR